MIPPPDDIPSLYPQPKYKNIHGIIENAKWNNLQSVNYMGELGASPNLRSLK